MKTSLLRYAALLLLAVRPAFSTAAEPDKSPVAANAMALYQGADRHERLVAAAGIAAAAGAAIAIAYASARPPRTGKAR